ncbi:HpcH/HpaI aldolase family protein [Paracoccus methylarcula]|nr:aldolase/citrate lyase family protein [Paracoccus methylarcula]
MTRNPFKTALRERRKLPGFWLSLCSPTVTEIASQSGADWLLVDMEHSPGDLSQISDHLRAATGGGAEVVVRPPFSEPVMVKRLLDIGVRNLMFPMIQTAEDAQQAVSWTRYPPRGIRGISATVRANRYARQKDYLQTYTEDMTIILQVETPQVVASIPGIAEVEGVDAIFIGPGDLAASMGHAGNVSAPEVRAKIVEAVSLIHEAGLPAGILGYGEETARGYFETDGIEFVAIAGDAWLLARHMDRMVSAFK